MAFRFSLATVLRIREISEERRERVLQRTLLEISEAVNALARMDAEISKTNALRDSDRFRPLSGMLIQNSYAAMKELKQNRVEMRDALAKLHEVRDEQIRSYEIARRDREMLTDMQDEKRGTYEADAARQEQKTLDDNFIVRRGRH
jgi:flagellar export protein FliJ